MLPPAARDDAPSADPLLPAAVTVDFLLEGGASKATPA